MTRRLTAGRAALFFWLMTLAYIALLVWADREKGILSGVERIYSIFPVLLLLSFCAFLARYARWRWLLAQAGASIPVLKGFLAYLSGFAFTASPGKVGELLRIRYFLPMGVTAELVISAFVFERVFDLLVLLGFASIAASEFGVFPVAVAFVSAVLFAVFVLVKYPGRIQYFSRYLARKEFRRLSRFVGIFARGFRNVSIWANPLDILVSLVAGCVAWGLTSCAFLLILGQLSLEVPLLASFSFYPVAMLAGAASMLPGGVGPTEAVLIVLLSKAGVDLSSAALAAMSIRLATLWFATLLGLISMLLLEHRVKANPLPVVR